jgi:hypothetical protein
VGTHAGALVSDDAEQLTSCPEGHPVPVGVRFCPTCGRFIAGADGERRTSEVTGTTRHRAASPWPTRILVIVVLVALAAIVVSLARSGRGGSEAPAVAPTTSVVQSSAATALPQAGTPCSPVDARVLTFSCEQTALGPIWVSVPFSRQDDGVGLLGSWTPGVPVPKDDLVDVGTITFGAGNLATRLDDQKRALWCTSIVLQNHATEPLEYSPDQFRLLDPRGDLTGTVAVDRFDPPPLAAGELSPGGSLASYVCFLQPKAPGGRMAVVFEPPGTPDRALEYFDGQPDTGGDLPATSTND